ncbi:hypothetical protein LINPERHAP1_LOCUS12762, partial [Linum perenne]
MPPAPSSSSGSERHHRDMIPQCRPDANRYSYTPPGSPGRDRTLWPLKKRMSPREVHFRALKPRYDKKNR